MIDVTYQITTVDRSLTSDSTDGDLRTMTIAQTYDTTVEDLWDACTSAERIPRWFLPVTGDLRLGGRYQLEGNAGGTVEACDPPHRFSATWEMGEMMSWIEVMIAPTSDGGARFELRHTARVEEHRDQFGPGAVGIGWDLGIMALALHIGGGEAVDPTAVEAWSTSEDGLRFMTLSSDEWRTAEVAFGEDPAVADRRAAATLAAYTGG